MNGQDPGRDSGLTRGAFLGADDAYNAGRNKAG